MPAAKICRLLLIVAVFLGIEARVFAVQSITDDQISVLQANNARLEKMEQTLLTVKEKNAELAEGINYLRIRNHKKGGGRRLDLEGELKQENKKLKATIDFLKKLIPDETESE